MNEEQNDTADGSENNNAGGKETAATGGTSNSDNDNAPPRDNYYAVDDAKKEVISTIGDGEMHNEGLVGAGEATTDIQSSTQRLSDEQDDADLHDFEQ